MISVFGEAGTPPVKAVFHLALPGGSGHALSALLAREATERVAAPNVPAANDDVRDKEGPWLVRPARRPPAERRRTSGSVFRFLKRPEDLLLDSPRSGRGQG